MVSLAYIIFPDMSSQATSQRTKLVRMRSHRRMAEQRSLKSIFITIDNCPCKHTRNTCDSCHNSHRIFIHFHSSLLCARCYAVHTHIILQLSILRACFHHSFLSCIHQTKQQQQQQSGTHWTNKQKWTKRRICVWFCVLHCRENHRQISSSAHRQQMPPKCSYTSLRFYFVFISFSICLFFFFLFRLDLFGRM